ncbi:MAG TPA: RNA methyltransferase [Acidimicrobiales bacterium]
MIEGAMLVREALSAGLALEALYLDERAPEDLRHLGAPVHDVDADTLARVASTEAPQPVLAVAPMCDVPLAAVAGASFVVVAHRLADPGNAGTILRTAEASGADAVVLSAGSVDLFNPKVVRASAGALFHVPVVQGPDLGEIGPALELPLVGAASTGGTPYRDFPLEEPLALVLGSEAHGFEGVAPDLLDDIVSIPHAGRAESLNVAMAAAVLCFEIAHRRRPLY